MKYTLIIPSGGVGNRLGAELPKQYLEVNGKSILNWTLSKFENIEGIEQLLIPSDNSYKDEIIKSIPESFQDKYQLTPHGETRFASIYNSIEYIDNDSDFIMVHDAVRPFITDELINKLKESANTYKTAVPYVCPTDTIKKINIENPDTFVEETLDRELLAAVQTPQVFDKDIFVSSYNYAKKNQFKGTDDSSILEYSNIFPKLIFGDVQNTKITTRFDLELSKTRLK
ncbi:MAG: 2-C-methyl-D-erythritol 4-phosphate cytidylyltransferase [Chlorobiota bacterium]